VTELQQQLLLVKAHALVQPVPRKTRQGSSTSTVDTRSTQCAEGVHCKAGFLSSMICFRPIEMQAKHQTLRSSPPGSVPDPAPAAPAAACHPLPPNPAAVQLLLLLRCHPSDPPSRPAALLQLPVPLAALRVGLLRRRSGSSRAAPVPAALGGVLGPAAAPAEVGGWVGVQAVSVGG
jgi:hypothetical protein